MDLPIAVRLPKYGPVWKPGYSNKHKKPATELTAYQKEVLDLYHQGLTFIEIDTRLGRTKGKRVGKCSPNVIDNLRLKGHDIPYRRTHPKRYSHG